MSLYRARAKEIKDSWYILCPVCRTRIELEECPVPGGMNNNIETCAECGSDIEVQPPPEKRVGF